MSDLEKRLKDIEQQIAKGGAIGRLPKIKSASADLEAAVQRVFAARPSHEMARAMTDLAAARDLAKKTWERVRMSGDDLASRSAASQFARAGGAEAVAPQQLWNGYNGIQVLFDWVRRLPHTYRTDKGKHCLTDRWISDGFLVFDPAREPSALGSVENPWFGINGPKFRCYYPNSSLVDWESCMTSGSSGRWLNAWTQKSNYNKF